MRFFNGRILFAIFIILCGSLLIMQQTAQLLTEAYYSRTYDFKSPVIGEVYKASWNRENDFVLHCKKYDVLIRGNNFSEEFSDKIRCAEYIELKTIPSVPEECSNFGAFDMREYLASKNIDLISYPKESDIVFVSPADYADLFHSMQFYGSKIRSHIEKALLENCDRDTASVCMSVMTGDGRLLESETKTSFQKAGLSHLMAVSGTHVAFALDPVKRLTRLVRNRRFGIKFKNTILIPFLFFIAFVAGFTPSIVRASVMCACMIFAVVFHRRYDPLNALGLAGLISIAVNPCCVFDAGFILSYCACLCIHIILPSLKNIKTVSKLSRYKTTESILCSIAVNLGLLPIIINLFNGFSFISIAVNIAAAPLAEMIYSGSFIITAAESIFLPPELCGVLSFPITAVVNFLEKCAGFSSNGVLGYREYPSIPTVYLVAYYSILIFAIIYLNKRLKKDFIKGLTLTGVSAVILIFVTIPPKAEFLFFDVGQGVSVLFSTRDGYKGLIDTGDGLTDLSYLLKRQGVSKLDFVVISHGHSDHCGGFFNVIENVECDVVFLSGNSFDEKASELAEIAEDKNIEVVFVEENVEISVGKYTDMMLACYGENSNINNSSLIASFRGKWGSAVLPGDIEAKSESCYSEDFSEPVDLLCVSHHGSGTSSTDEFLKTLSPKYAIISVGKDNMYGHPSSAVVDRIDNFTVSGDVYRTDRCGAVKFCFGVLLDFDGDDIYIWQKKRPAE